MTQEPTQLPSASAEAGKPGWTRRVWSSKCAFPERVANLMKHLDNRASILFTGKRGFLGALCWWYMPVGKRGSRDPTS